MAIEINETRSTPYVIFSDGVLTMGGRAIPEHPVKFFEELMSDINDYSQDPKEVTTANFHFEYVNSGAKRALVDILSLFEKINKKVIVNWYTREEDEDIYELGNELNSLTELTFSFKTE
jgi:hypothetical protein